MKTSARAARTSPRAGFTLVETALLVCVIGVVLAVFVPTFIRHLRTSKIAEAPAQLERLHETAAAYYAAVHVSEAEGSRHMHCLPPRAGPTPPEPSATPVQIDFAADETRGSTTWKALAFAPERPLRYRYTFEPSRSGCNLHQHDAPVEVLFRAEGDLDDDGTLSTFERRAVSNGSGQLVPKGLLYAEDRVE